MPSYKELCKRGDFLEMPPYPFQYCQNESLDIQYAGLGYSSYGPLRHWPLINITGTIYLNQRPIQVFASKLQEGTSKLGFMIDDIGTFEKDAIKATHIYLNENRTIGLCWWKEGGDTFKACLDDPFIEKYADSHVVVSYEYDYEKDQTFSKEIGWLIAWKTDEKEPYSYDFLSKETPLDLFIVGDDMETFRRGEGPATREQAQQFLDGMLSQKILRYKKPVVDGYIKTIRT